VSSAAAADKYQNKHISCFPAELERCAHVLRSTLDLLFSVHRPSFALLYQIVVQTLFSVAQLMICLCRHNYVMPRDNARGLAMSIYSRNTHKMSAFLSLSLSSTLEISSFTRRAITRGLSWWRVLELSEGLTYVFNLNLIDTFLFPPDKPPGLYKSPCNFSQNVSFQCMSMIW
jgi:hypothetical protein